MPCSEGQHRSPTNVFTLNSRNKPELLLPAYSAGICSIGQYRPDQLSSNLLSTNGTTYKSCMSATQVTSAHETEPAPLHRQGPLPCTPWAKAQHQLQQPDQPGAATAQDTEPEPPAWFSAQPVWVRPQPQPLTTRGLWHRHPGRNRRPTPKPAMGMLPL
jgi:hypothetical protein